MTDMITNEGSRLQDWIKDPPNYPDSDPIWGTEVPCVGGFRGSSTIIGFNVVVYWTGDEKLEFFLITDAFNDFEAVQVLFHFQQIHRAIATF